MSDSNEDILKIKSYIVMDEEERNKKAFWRLKKLW